MSEKQQKGRVHQRVKRKKKKPTEAPPLFHEISHPKKRAFLANFVTHGGVYRAAMAAGINARSHYYWLKNPAYESAFDRAKEIAGDFAEDEVFRRAFHGTDHPVIHKGVITDTYKEYSDTLAMFYLKALRPDKYRENLNLSGAVHGTVEVFTNVDPYAGRRKKREQERE